MQLTAQEIALVHYSLNQIPVLEQDKPLLREIRSVIVSFTAGEGDEKHFVDSEVELSTLQKAFVIKSMKSLPWNSGNWDLVDKVVEKLN